MDARPKLKIVLTPIDKVVELTGLLTLLFMWGLTLYSYANVPDTVPTHFNASGHPDGFGNKSSIFILPVIGTILFFSMTWLNKYPHIFNYPVNITTTNALYQYTNSTRAIRYTKTIIIITFTLIIVFTYLTATGRSSGLGIWFLPLTFLLTLAPTAYFIIRAIKVANDKGG